jgi:hypothetical protein
MMTGRAPCWARAARSPGSLVSTTGSWHVLANAATIESAAEMVAARPVAARRRPASLATGSVTARIWQARSRLLRLGRAGMRGAVGALSAA